MEQIARNPITPIRFRFNGTDKSSIQKNELLPFRELYNHINSVVSLSENNLQEIVNAFQIKTFRKNAYLLEAGHYCNCYYFVMNGAFRVYAHVNGKEITSWIASQNSFFTELESYYDKKPSRFNIRALEESKVCYIAKSKMDEFLVKFPTWNEFLRKNWELSFLDLQNDIFRNLNDNRKEKQSRGFFSYFEFVRKLKILSISSIILSSIQSLSRIWKNI